MSNISLSSMQKLSHSINLVGTEQIEFEVVTVVEQLILVSHICCPLMRRYCEQTKPTTGKCFAWQHDDI